MKINLNQIPAGELIVEEAISAQGLDLETAEIKFLSPVKIRAAVSMITNAVSVHLDIKTALYTECSRCLKKVEFEINKKLDLNFQVSASERAIDLDPDIREEIILNYPIKPLCKPDCQGLCPKCGKTLNEGGCSCGST